MSRHYFEISNNPSDGDKKCLKCRNRIPKGVSESYFYCDDYCPNHKTTCENFRESITIREEDTSPITEDHYGTVTCNGCTNDRGHCFVPHKDAPELGMGGNIACADYIGPNSFYRECGRCKRNCYPYPWTIDGKLECHSFWDGPGPDVWSKDDYRL